MHHHDPQPGDLFVNLSCGMFNKGAIVQLVELRGGSSPYLCVPLTDNQCRFSNGPNGTPGAFVGNLGKDDRFVFLAHVPLDHRRTPNAHGWAKGDLAVVTASDHGVYAKGNIVKLSADDRTDCPYFKLLHGEPKRSPAGERSVKYHRLTRIKTWAERRTTDSTRPVIRPGSYFECSELDRETFLAIAQAFIEAGIPRGELDRPYPHQSFKYFGWHEGTGGFFKDSPYQFCVDSFIRNPQDLISSTSTQESTTMSTNPFKAGDKVVPNGFRYSKPGSREHHYGTNSTMERWEREKTVLTVHNTSEHRARSGTDGNNYAYHPSELRLATPEEIKAAEVKVTTSALPDNARGTVVKMNNGRVAILISQRPDGDGDYRAAFLDGADGAYARKSNIAEVLGQVMADGDFRPGTRTIADDASPITWKRGDKVRCTNAQAFMTVGRIYTLTTDAVRRGDHFVIDLHDNDGDRTTRHANGFELVSRA